jgi:hypothetical protein
LVETKDYYVVKPFINEPHYIRNDTLPGVEVKQKVMNSAEIDDLICDWDNAKE